jgi:hypothetical protein
VEPKPKKEKKEKKAKPYDQKDFIEKVLRGAFKKTPMYHAAKRRAKEEFTVESKHGKPMRRVHFKCALCGRFFLDKKGAKEIAVDHIEPVVPVDRPLTGVGEYVERLYCKEENLQVLCNYTKLRDGVKACHKIKTAEENAARAAATKERENATGTAGKN